MIRVTTDLIQKFLSRETTPQESDELGKWLSEDSENQAEFDAAYDSFVLAQLSLEKPAVQKIRKGSMARRTRVAIAWTAVIAASLAIGVFVNDYFFTRPAQKKINTTTLVSLAEPGTRSKVILSDGTKIELNSGSTVTYPAIFDGKTRRVRLDGEAMFEVAHDAGHPFYVETYAYDIKVLGTTFDVVADETSNTFRTALLEGSVSILDKSASELTTLSPDMMVTLKDGRLVKSRITDNASYQWTEGIVSLAGLGFTEIMERLETCYGVNIRIETDNIPDVTYPYLKFRVSEGVEHAFKVLGNYVSFKYSYDRANNIYHIY